MWNRWVHVHVPSRDPNPLAPKHLPGDPPSYAWRRARPWSRWHCRARYLTWPPSLCRISLIRCQTTRSNRKGIRMEEDKYWIRMSLLGYAWVIFPMDGFVMASLHIPQTDDVALLCTVDSVAEARRRIDLLCPVDSEQWVSYKTREAAGTALRSILQLRQYWQLRHASFKDFPHTGICDRSPDTRYSKLAFRYGLPATKWEVKDTIAIWTGILYELDAVIREAKQSGATNLLARSAVRASVTDFFRPLTGRRSCAGLDKHLNTCFGRHLPLLLKWKRVLYNVRNDRCTHLGKDWTFGIEECCATRALVSQACDVWAQGNVPIEDQVYNIPPRDVENLMIALCRANAIDEDELNNTHMIHKAISQARLTNAYRAGDQKRIRQAQLRLSAALTLAQHNPQSSSSRPSNRVQSGDPAPTPPDEDSA